MAGQPLRIAKGLASHTSDEVVLFVITHSALSAIQHNVISNPHSNNYIHVQCHQVIVLSKLIHVHVHDVFLVLHDVFLV